MKTRFLVVAVLLCVLTNSARAQIPMPKMPHLPDVRIPEIKVPKIEMPDEIAGVPIGHKTNKWEIRHNLEKDGWWVAYGKEIGYQEYYAFYNAVVASVASENPGPAMAYLQALIEESVRVLAKNAGQRFGTELQQLAQKQLVAAMKDAMVNGRIRTLNITGAQIQLGMATYNRSESGVPLPNTFQPYLRMRLTTGNSGGGAGSPGRPKYRWVATVYNSTNATVNYTFLDGSESKKFSITPNGWIWHSADASNPPDFKLVFDNGPDGGHHNLDYHLNCNRLSIGTQPTDMAGEPYVFGYVRGKGWELFSGRPIRSGLWEVNYNNQGVRVIDQYRKVNSGQWERTLTENGTVKQKYTLRVLADFCPVHVDLDDAKCNQFVRIRSNGDMDIYRRAEKRWDRDIFNGSNHGWR
jgi:hypothetical protein